jgi:hypothetical protein
MAMHMKVASQVAMHVPTLAVADAGKAKGKTLSPLVEHPNVGERRPQLKARSRSDCISEHSVNIQ